MKKTFLFFLLIYFTYNSFTSGDVVFNSYPNKSLFYQDQNLSLDSIVKIDPLWFNYYKKKNSEFDYNKFTNTGKRRLPDFINGNILGDFDNGFNESQYQFLIESPNKEEYIDLDSYQLSIEKDKNGQLITLGEEPDQEVNWVNRKTKEIKRIYFSGNDSRIEDAKWINNSIVLLFGMDFKKLTIRIIDLQRRTSTLFQYPKSLTDLGNYTQEIRLQKIKFK